MDQCKHLHQLGMFPLMIKFLLGVDLEVKEGDNEGEAMASEATVSNPKSLLGQRRRWTSMQVREFGELHVAISYLVLACNLASLREETGKMLFLFC